MKSRLNNIFRLSFVILVIAGVFNASCKREPLYETEDLRGFKLILKPRWVELDDRPTGVTAIIYPVNGGDVMYLTSNVVDSIVVVLRAGSYRALVFNQTIGEYDALKFRHMDSYYDCEACVDQDTEYKTPYSIKPGSFMAKQPEILAVDCCNEISVTADEINSAFDRGKRITKTVTMKPHVVISTMYISVRVNGIYNAYQVEGCIDGMSKQVYMTYFDTGENLASHVVTKWSIDPDFYGSSSGYLNGTCTTMGMPGTSLYLSSSASVETGEERLQYKSGFKSETDPEFKPEDILLHMHVKLVDQETVVDTTFQVGDLITRTINQPLILKLNTGDLHLPDVKPKGGADAAFDAEVEDWGEEEETTINF